MQRALTVVRIAVIIAAVVSGMPPARAEQALVALARVGPWHGVSALIGYRGRLWFANSEKFVNHNSADIYSYAPGDAAPRYERHLFSKDVGDPLVAGGLLFWPFEDARFSTGQGELMVTNGRVWRWRVLPDAAVFHVHALIANRGALYAATATWRAGIQRSDDLGRSWRAIYDHPTPHERVSRFTSLGVLDGTVYAGLTSYTQPGPKLYRFPDDQPQVVPGWPEGVRTDTLARFGDWLYAVNSQAEKRTVWRTDGVRVERVHALDGVAVQAFASGARFMWAVSGGGQRGGLWRSADGEHWRRIQRFAEALPLAVTVFAGRPYVGTLGPGERGTLWGPADVDVPAAPVALVPLPKTPARPLTAARLRDGLAALDKVLAGTATSFGELRRDLASAIDPLIAGRSPILGKALAARLIRLPPGVTLAGFGGRLRVRSKQVKQWYLLRAIGLVGSGGRIPVAMLETPWIEASNEPEKYFSPFPAALWAVGQLGQRDPATIAALVTRLGTRGEPAWVDGDRIGALTAITGRRFGYDRTAWRRWWAARSGTPDAR